MLAVAAALAAVAAGAAGTAGADGVPSTPSSQTPRSPVTPDEPLVRGTLVFEPSRPDLSGATVRVRLEEVSRADASARVVAERTIDDPADRLSGDGLPFALSGSRNEIDSGGRYSVAAHVDVDDDGEVSTGDFVTMESHPVLTRGHPDEVTVSVRKVE